MVEAESLPYTTAQAAKLVVLASACELSKAEIVTIYTDSKNTLGVLHDFAKTWTQRIFKPAKGKPIGHSDLIWALINALQLASKVAIVDVKGHATGD